MTNTTMTNDDPAKIERDIRRTQDDMSRTVDKIGDQLTPRNLLNGLLDKADENGIDARYLVDGARRNPLNQVRPAMTNPTASRAKKISCPCHAPTGSGTIHANSAVRTVPSVMFVREAGRRSRIRIIPARYLQGNRSYRVRRAQSGEGSSKTRERPDIGPESL